MGIITYQSVRKFGEADLTGGYVKIRFVLMGIILWALSGILFGIRGYHPNFFIPLVVGTFIFLYGLFSR